MPEILLQMLADKGCHVAIAERVGRSIHPCLNNALVPPPPAMTIHSAWSNPRVDDVLLFTIS